MFTIQDNTKSLGLRGTFFVEDKPDGDKLVVEFGEQCIYLTVFNGAAPHTIKLPAYAVEPIRDKFDAWLSGGSWRNDVSRS